MTQIDWWTTFHPLIGETLRHFAFSDMHRTPENHHHWLATCKIQKIRKSAIKRPIPWPTFHLAARLGQPLCRKPSPQDLLGSCDSSEMAFWMLHRELYQWEKMVLQMDDPHSDPSHKVGTQAQSGLNLKHVAKGRPESKPCQMPVWRSPKHW